MSKPKENVRFIQHTDDDAVGIPPLVIPLFVI